MRKVLIIGYPWPYLNGSKRVMGLARHLPKFGWEPVLLSAPLDEISGSNVRIIETDYCGFMGSWVRLFGLNSNKDLGSQLKVRHKNTHTRTKAQLRYCFTLLKEIMAYPDEHRGWYRFAVKDGEEVIRNEHIDAIISTWPLTSHIVAHHLKRNYKIPWIADLADLWSQNSAYAFGKFRRKIDENLEKRMLVLADILTTSSQPLAERLRFLHNRSSVPDILIGFETDDSDEEKVNLTSEFTITYTGILYKAKREPSKFFCALSDLISENALSKDHIQVRFYGPQADWAQHDIAKYKLAGVVRQHGTVPLSECLRKQKESQLLLQLNWNDPAEKGVFSGKLLDYLIARRPILAAGGAGYDEVVKEILAKTKSGVYAPKIEEIKHYLIEAYTEYKSKGEVKYNGIWEEVQKYSNENMAIKFASLLDQITKMEARDPTFC
jgi:hypothetical protein